jgi:DNA-binding SARP family transcriptional activator
VSGALPERPPHYPRVRTLLGAFDAPVVQLWGWAGTGKRAILAALLEDEAGAKHVPAAWLREPDRLEERLSHNVGRRAALLICEAGEDDDVAIGRLAALLAPRQRLLVAGERRLDLGRDALVVPAEQVLMRPDEIEALWNSIGVRALTPPEGDWLHRRSDGWYFPLALWARDPTTANGPFDDEARFGCEAIEDFLRDRVLATLTADEVELARELARRGRVEWRAFGETASGQREEVLRSMIERTALPRVDDRAVRLPRLLAEYLARDERHRASSLPATRNWRDERDPVIADVRIGLLGVPRVERRETGAMVPVEWSFKRPLRILAYLASAPDLQASREEIVSILWPESSEDAIRRNLHPAMSWLRRSVWPGGDAGGVVLLRDGVYSLDPTLHWEVDVRLFLERIEDGARHLARGRVEEAEASWEAAWRLYQGAFLQGWSELWVQAQRDELQLRFTDLLRRLGDLKAKHGRLAEAEDAYRTLLLEDPLEEGVHVAIMRIYAARGRRDLVNRQFERLRQVLMQELRVEPSPPTMEAFNELMLAPRAYR